MFYPANLMMMWKKDNQLFILNNKVLTQEPSQDPRIQVTPLKSGNILSVKKAEQSDAGFYSCQVKPVIKTSLTSIFFNLVRPF